MQEVIKVTVNLPILAQELSKNGKYVTTSEVSRRLGVSMKTAGKILSRLEQLGLARRYSYRTYELSTRSLQLSDLYVLTTANERINQVNVINK